MIDRSATLRYATLCYACQSVLACLPANTERGTTCEGRLCCQTAAAAAGESGTLRES
ncbi:hypothetical protein BDW60DRAFT_200283 [Aspergillus nidulans var. acristatus]